MLLIIFQSIKANFNKVKELHTEEYKDMDKEKETASIDKANSDGLSSVEETEDNMVIHAYRRTWFGDIMLVIYCLQTLGQVAYMILITDDYYNDYALFRGYFLIQSSTFMGMWYFFFFWFAALTIFRFRLPNYFRIRCTYGQGQYVQVERKEPGKVLYYYWCRI